ncbi:MAG: membrane protein insertion efficiency factor YidD [Candidatus Hydrogenedentota bacterium]|nr:MAG: membrane protein insertion efficiency factor YidD [Candidatus Hydrogenedentota bacterium]
MIKRVWGVVCWLGLQVSCSEQLVRVKLYVFVRRVDTNINRETIKLNERLCYFVIGCVVSYQHRISPSLPSCCRYSPSCSQYSLDALVKYGLVKGMAKTVWRILRCNPLSSGGIDQA